MNILQALIIYTNAERNKSLIYNNISGFYSAISLQNTTFILQSLCNRQGKMMTKKYNPKDFKPCPFCGGGIDIRSLGTPWRSTVVLDSFDIQCIGEDCGIRFTGTLPAGLGLTAWNRRAPDKHQQAVIKAADGFVYEEEPPTHWAPLPVFPKPTTGD